MRGQKKTEAEVSPFLPEIRRGRFDKLTIFEISEAELEALAKGSPDSTYLSFAIGLLSIATAFSITLATTTIASDRTFFVFVIAVILGFVLGLVFLILWWKTRVSVSCLVDTIKERLPPIGASETVNISDSLVIATIDQTRVSEEPSE